MAEEPTVENPKEPFAPQETLNADTNETLVNETVSEGKYFSDFSVDCSIVHC